MALPSTKSTDPEIESLRKANRAEAERIFHFLSLCTQLYDGDKRRYIKSFAKHVYRWARMNSYHQVYFGQKTNDKKIQQLMAEFSTEFNRNYLPPMEHTLFYELYPSNSLRDLVRKHRPKGPHTVSPVRISPLLRARRQKILFLMDWDDTLIPTTMLKKRKYNITQANSSIAELDEYCKTLHIFMDTILRLIDFNSDRNIQILTNGSTDWVKEDSLFYSGHLFAVKMASFARKLSKYKIDIISALDNWQTACKYDKARGYNKVEAYKWKWKIMSQLFREYFGRRLDGSMNIKIVSIGDSYKSEYIGAGVAFSGYLAKQNMKKTKDIEMSLHRIKFVDEPTLPQLTKQLKWCIKNIGSIVMNAHKSKNYMLAQHI